MTGRVPDDAVGGRGASHRQPSPTVAAMIRELVRERHQQKLTQRQVLDLMGPGWSLTVLQHIEGGHQAPSAEFLLAWSRALRRPITLPPRDDQ